MGNFTFFNMDIEIRLQPGIAPAISISMYVTLTASGGYLNKECIFLIIA